MACCYDFAEAFYRDEVMGGGQLLGEGFALGGSPRVALRLTYLCVARSGPAETPMVRAGRRGHGHGHSITALMIGAAYQDTSQKPSRTSRQALPGL